MRNTEKWDEQYRESSIKQHFPPRLQHDLNKFKKEFPMDCGSYFIFGDIATGKTVLAGQIMIKFMKEDYLNEKMQTYLFVSFPDFLVDLRDTYNNKKISEREVLKRFFDVDVLILDDFLTTRPTDWMIDVVYHLINHRYEYMKTVIITCNKSLEQLEETLGDQRITSRINRMCELIQKKPF